MMQTSVTSPTAFASPSLSTNINISRECGMVVGRNDVRDDRKRGHWAWPDRDHLQGSVSANAINSSVGARSRDR